VKFDGTANTTVPALIALTPVTGVAAGVGIQIADVSGKEVPLFGTSDAFTLAEGSNNLAFVARYYATAATVTAGPANGTANFTIIYN
jgi:major type 1 subunit fimbrin (pilin)